MSAMEEVIDLMAVQWLRRYLEEHYRARLNVFHVEMSPLPRSWRRRHLLMKLGFHSCKQVAKVPLKLKTGCQALIHMESILSLPKQIDHRDSLVEKFIAPGPDNPNPASYIEREDLSSIFLEFLDLFGDTKTIKKPTIGTRSCLYIIKAPRSRRSATWRGI
ncbi:hypothetical protein L2E82_29059 [Cichorium intybus]|uniref:Uncharacterized protein n=1 Tax=Cichorium intybus TaxID=13427 RepID=A0ACB9CXG2_CICIN|nr:hypothetical protein L2E82_29059 [Cichorium intybus]